MEGETLEWYTVKYCANEDTAHVTVISALR